MDKEAIEKHNYRNERDDDSRKEMSQERTSSLSNIKQETHKGEHKQKEISQRQQKTIEAQKRATKFRPVLPVLTQEVKITESDKNFVNIISNIVIIEEGLITYSHNCMTIYCMTSDGNRNDVPCQSSVTDFTRIGEDMVLATLPFRKMILSISPTSFKIRTIQLALYLVSYFEHSTIIGVEMFGKTVYCFDWEENRIKYEFIIKETPTDIAVGAQHRLLISFSKTLICYNVYGQQLWELGIYLLDVPIKISLYQNYFYVLQGHIIYRISAEGGVIKRNIGRKCRSISVGKGIILVTDCFGIPRAIRTNKDFWPKMSYNHQLHIPSLKHYIYFEDCNYITNILPMSASSIFIVYRNKKAMLVADTGQIINQNNFTFLEMPSIFCRINSSQFLVIYREMKGLQQITCPELSKGPLIAVQTDYIKICHIVSNKCLALTTSKNINEIHILLIKENKIDVIKRICLRHYNVNIATTPTNFVVVDGRENKMIFYSTSGEELFEKYLPFYSYPHHIYSDNIYFYVLFKRQSTVICYDIYGEIKWQWKVPFSVHSHIAIFQGTVYILDVELNKVLFYKYHDCSGCCLRTKNPYIRNLNIRLKDKENDKVVIAEICHLTNGQLVVSDINHDCLLYISNEGDIVSRLSLPSTSTDICRWDSNEIGVILPLEKQLRIIGNLSKTVRTVSLNQPYVRVCKLSEGQIVCYSDKPSHLDILAIKYHDQVEIVHRIKIPFVVKSLSMEKETQKLLIVIKGKAFQYSTTIRSGGHHGDGPQFCSIKMDPSVLLSQVKHTLSLYGGSIDKLFIYLIENSRIFAINDRNLLVNDLITSNPFDIHFDLVDIFSRTICVSEMLSSTSYLQDLTVSDKARYIHLPQRFRDKEPVEIDCLTITENNLIAGCDKDNASIKIFTFDGQLLDSLKLNVYEFIKICRWKSNTLVITTGDYSGNKYQLLTLKVEFPLSVLLYQTRNEYKCIASLSNNQIVCSKLKDECSLYFIDIDEIHSTVNEIKEINIPETLLMRDIHGNCINNIEDITVNADVIIVHNGKFIIFFNSDGQYLHSVTHYMKYDIGEDKISTDDNYLYIHGGWDKDLGMFGYKNVVRLTQAGEYNGIFLNKRIYRHEVYFLSINCKGPRFVGSQKEWKRENELYVEGYFMVNRESFLVSRLQTDECRVEVKDIDISDEGKTVVCEKANNGNVKIFNRFGKLLCYRNVASLVGGVCFTHNRNIMATIPKRKEIFQLNRKDLQKYKVWKSEEPYGVIWRRKENIYWCVHIEFIECHCIKIDGDRVNILQSVSLLNLDSDLHFPSITSQMNKEELFNKLKYSGEDGDIEEGRKRCKSVEIIGKGRLKVRCGNYIAESMLGIDEISVRRLPHRTTMVPLSIPIFKEPVNYDVRDLRDRNSRLITLDDNVSVLIFRESITLINTATGDILQDTQQPQPPLDICQWTNEHFVVVFGKETMVFNRNLFPLKTIKTKKYYNKIYKYNDNQLVCGGHHIRDSYYVDIVDVKDGECKYEVCDGKMGKYGKFEGDVVVDVGVTSFGDVVVVKWELKKNMVGGLDNLCFVEWFREKTLVRRIRLEEINYLQEYDIQGPRLTKIDEYLYITDRENNIYQIPGHIEQQTSEDIEVLTLKDIQKYLLLRKDENEVFQVLGFDISEISFMVFGIIPGRQSFAFFHYDK